MSRAKRTFKPKRIFESGQWFAERWLDNNEPADLESAITCFSLLDYLLRHDDVALRPRVEIRLGFCLWARYGHTRSAADRDQAIGALARAVRWPGAPDDFRLALGQMITERLGVSEELALTDAKFGDDMNTALSVLAVAASSAELDADDLAQAKYLYERMTVSQAILRARETLLNEDTYDVAELQAMHRNLAADDPLAPYMAKVIGLAYGFQFLTGFRPEDYRLATEYLTEAMDGLDPADPERPAVAGTLAAVLQAGAAAAPERAPAERILGLLSEAMTAPGFPPGGLALLHTLTAAAYGTRAEDIPAVLAHIGRAKDLISDDPRTRAALLCVIFATLMRRSRGRFDFDHYEAAAAYLREALSAVDKVGLPEVGTYHEELPKLAQLTHPGILHALLAAVKVDGGFFRRDLQAIDEGIGELDRALASLPSGYAWRAQVVTKLADSWRTRAALSGEREDSLRALRLCMAAGEHADEDTLEHRELRRDAAAAQAELGCLTADRSSADQGVQRLLALGDESAMAKHERARWLAHVGRVLFLRNQFTGDPQDLEDAIASLEELRHDAEPVPGLIEPSALLLNLAMAYRSRGDKSRGDPQRAIDTGLARLREQAAEVVLQSGAERGVRVAGWYGGSLPVTQLVSWCLADGRREQALEALELGRALVLQAATVAAGAAGLLRAAGHEELAARWESELADRTPAPWDGAPGTGVPPLSAGQPLAIPADTRGKVLAVLRGTPAGASLLAPLERRELTDALRRSQHDAFIYLIPPHESSPGRALVLSADGALDEIPLPDLIDEPVASYDAAHRAWIKSADDGAFSGWQTALADLCDWAWEAATGPVLHHAARWQLGRPPRLVLIPAGLLRIVPWHAARTSRADGEPHYAVEDAVFSYAASARQFADALGRPRRPLADSAVLVANPTGDLPMAGYEARMLRRRFYPEAVLLGRSAQASGEGTPEQVLARLPGGSAAQASLLHCGCHATVAGSLAESHLLLAGARKLPIAQIIEQAQGRDPQAPGFLAVLGSCQSDLTDIDHDEALTLASALLAAGASGVVGALWAIEDWAAALLMVVFHHFLNRAHAHPAGALRAAQLWMLGQDRTPLDPLPIVLAHAAANLDLTGIHVWAGFTYQGA